MSAGETLDGARVMRANGHHNLACSLAEHGAQLALKGWLHGVGVGASAWGHDLPQLGARIAEESAEAWVEDLEQGLQRLSRHYVSSRYPDAFESGTPAAHFSDSDSAQAIADAERVLADVRRRWSDLTP